MATETLVVTVEQLMALIAREGGNGRVGVYYLLRLAGMLGVLQFILKQRRVGCIQLTTRIASTATSMLLSNFLLLLPAMMMMLTMLMLLMFMFVWPSLMLFLMWTTEFLTQPFHHSGVLRQQQLRVATARNGIK